MPSVSIPESSTGQAPCCLSHPISLKNGCAEDSCKNELDFDIERSSSRDHEPNPSSKDFLNHIEKERVIKPMVESSKSLEFFDFDRNRVMDHRLNDAGLAINFFSDDLLNLVEE